MFLEDLKNLNKIKLLKLFSIMAWLFLLLRQNFPGLFFLLGNLFFHPFLLFFLFPFFSFHPSVVEIIDVHVMIVFV